MSDYRRIVSYIYRYENGAKSTNEGYVRLEIRDGQLKCTVHITSQSLRDALVKVYFYVRKGDSITGILLGEMNVSAGNGDFKETTEALSIMGTGAALEDTGGMILSYVPNLFYATEWDDRPVTKEDMAGVTGAEVYGAAGAAGAEAEEEERSAFVGGSGSREDSEEVSAIAESAEAESPAVSAAEESPGWEGAKVPELAWPNRTEELQAKADIQAHAEESDDSEDSVAAAEYADYPGSDPFEEQSAAFRDIGMGEPESEWDEEYKDDALLRESVEEAAAAGQTAAQVEYYTYGRYGRLEPAPAQDLENRQGRTNWQSGPGQQMWPEQQMQTEQQIQREQRGVMPQGGRLQQDACAQRIPSPADCGCSDREPERILREGVPMSREQMKDCSPMTAPMPDSGQTIPDYRIPVRRPEPQNCGPQPDQESGTGRGCQEVPVQPGIRNPMMSREPVPESEPQYSEPQFSEPSEQPVPAEPQPQEESQEGGAGSREALLCSLDEKPLARTMLDNFPKISPFQDTEIAECVRIVPQNIGLLPIDAWVLGNNSFLQHGYYNHKHLIFAKKYTRSGIMYLLGVPGYFTQRERNMARMFGFNNFKSAKMRPVQNGEFGYWYVPIVF